MMRRLIKRFSRDKRANHEFDEADRAHSTAVREHNREMKRISREMDLLRQRAALKRLKADLEGIDDAEGENMDIDAMLERILRLAEASKGVKPEEKQTLSDDEIKAIIEKIPPEQLKIAQKASDEDLIVQIRQDYPNLSDDTVLRAVLAVRAWKKKK